MWFYRVLSSHSFFLSSYAFFFFFNLIYEFWFVFQLFLNFLTNELSLSEVVSFQLLSTIVTAFSNIWFMTILQFLSLKKLVIWALQPCSLVSSGHGLYDAVPFKTNIQSYRARRVERYFSPCKSFQYNSREKLRSQNHQVWERPIRSSSLTFD